MKSIFKKVMITAVIIFGVFILAYLAYYTIEETRRKTAYLESKEITFTPSVTITSAPRATILTPKFTPSLTKKPFGPFDWVPDGEKDYTLTRVGNKIEYLKAAQMYHAKAFIALTGSRWRYTDEKGCFDLQMWKDELDRQDLNGIQPFVDDGTVIGLYAVDEPNDWDCGPSYEELNEICRYAHQRLPGIACGFNEKPAWLASGSDRLTELDYLFVQTNFNKTKNWTAWAQEKFNEAEWFDGPVYLSINAYTGNPTVEQVENAAIELCQSNAAGVLIWKWDYIQEYDLSLAISTCAGSRYTPK